MKDAKLVRIDEDGRHVYRLPSVIHNVDIKIDISEDPEVIEVKTKELIGPVLDWAVAQVEGVNYRKDGIKGKTRIAPRKWHNHTKSNFSPSTDWSWGGPLIDKFMIGFGVYSDAYLAVIGVNEMSGAELGPTHLIAACRAIVAAKLGDTVSVPKELIQ